MGVNIYIQSGGGRYRSPICHTPNAVQARRPNSALNQHLACVNPPVQPRHPTVLLPAVQPPPPFKCDVKVSGHSRAAISPIYIQYCQNTFSASPADIDSASLQPIAPACLAMRLRPARINRPPAAIVAWTRQAAATPKPLAPRRPAPCAHQSRPCLFGSRDRRCRTMRLKRRDAGGQTQGTTE